MDVSDPSTHDEKKHAPVIDDSALDMAINGQYAYIVDGHDLIVADVSQPTQPSVVSRTKVVVPRNTLNVAVEDEYAYVLDEYLGLRIVNVSDPAHPREVGHCEMDGVPFSVAIAGDYAYIATGHVLDNQVLNEIHDHGGALQIVDVSDPTAPEPVGSFETRGSALQVALAGDDACLVDGAGLQVVDVSNPKAPNVVGTFDIADAIGVAVAGDNACIATDSGRLWIVNASELRTIHTRRRVTLGLAVLGGVILALMVFLLRRRLRRFRFAFLPILILVLMLPPVTSLLFVPHAPQVVGVADPPADSPGKLRSVATVGHYAYVAYYALSPSEHVVLRVLDVSDPVAPSEVGSYSQIGGDFVSVTVADDHAYLAHPRTNYRMTGLTAVDVSDPAGSHEYLGPTWYVRDPRHVAVAGDYAYVADGRNGLRVFEIDAIFRSIGSPQEVRSPEVGFYMP